MDIYAEYRIAKATILGKVVWNMRVPRKDIAYIQKE